VARDLAKRRTAPLGCAAAPNSQHDLSECSLAGIHHSSVLQDEMI